MIRRALLRCAVSAVILAASGLVARAGPSALVVTGVVASGPTISATVSNPTPREQRGYLILVVTLQGHSLPTVTSVPLTLTAMSTAEVDATYPTAATLESIGTSDSARGHGITESEDPIICIVIIRDR